MLDDDEEWRPTPSSLNNKKSRKTTKNNASSSSSPPTPSPPQSSPTPPVLPEEFKNHMRELNGGGSEMQFVMSKNLSKTDVSAKHNRLSMPQSEICCDFLTEAEKATLHEREGRLLRGVEVKVLDPSFREHTLILKRWEMTSTSIYSLNKEWKSVVSQNRLQEGDQLQIWSCRVDAQLFLLLNKLI
ncbi:B3 domain-containing protein At2g31720-like [Gastrolobium bilobum]|uniref:B3 domain-containing protein At2g31720-like n=2 Tax=Gastrolobium bilobum TaxID=150636 RepID=UPI002AB16B7D|nr:B3 domain-containing protein At2g31720-like [Gastrolobium bilobum]XP_061374586.1 B3 domain-containing protein At2g31720-like [Gastrolobium bilobum]